MSIPDFCELRCPICTRARNGNRIARALQAVEMGCHLRGMPIRESRQRKYGVPPSKPLCLAQPGKESDRGMIWPRSDRSDALCCGPHPPVRQPSPGGQVVGSPFSRTHSAQAFWIVRSSFTSRYLWCRVNGAADPALNGCGRATSIPDGSPANLQDDSPVWGRIPMGVSRLNCRTSSCSRC